MSWKANISLVATRALAGLVGLVLLCGCASFGIAAEGLIVESGFDSVTKVGRWTPVWVTGAVVDAAASAEVEAIDPDGIRLSYPLARTTDAAWTGTFQSGRLDAEWIVRLRDANRQVVAEQRVSPSPDAVNRVSVARQSVRLWAEIGFDKPLLETSDRLPLIRSDEWLAKLREDARRSLNADDFVVFGSAEWPRNANTPWACDAFDGMLVSSRLSLSPDGESELIRWVRRGGHLVLSVTTDRDDFQATTWGKWLGNVVDVRERTRTTDMSGVEGFTIQSRKIKTTTPIPVTILAPRDGRVLVPCSQGPLVTQSSVGFGIVTVIGMDLTKPPFLTWEARPTFLKRLLAPRVETAESLSNPEITRLSQTGISDLASQWRAAAIQLPGITRPSLWAILGWLLLYAAVIGPLDYAVVHKLFRRPHWTWWTAPTWVLLASLGTMWYAHAANGDAEPLTQLDVIDIDVATHEVRAQSWATVYSRDHRLWKAEARPSALTGHAADQPAGRVSWLGFPETAAGGLYRPSGFDLNRTTAQTNPERTQWDHLPIGRWSSKSLTAETTWAPAAPLIEASFSSPFSGELVGSMTHHFPGALEDWLIVFEDRVYRPDPRQGDEAGRWEPNTAWAPQNKVVNSRVLRGFLTRSRAIKVKSSKNFATEDVLVEQERYDQLNLEPDHILQMLTLHEAAGGKGHTGLAHDSLRRFELTTRLTLGRALLIARIAKPTTRWSFDATAREPDRSDSFVRALIPVRWKRDASDTFRVLPKFEKGDFPPPEKPKDGEKSQPTEAATSTNNSNSPEKIQP